MGQKDSLQPYPSTPALKAGNSSYRLFLSIYTALCWPSTPGRPASTSQVLVLQPCAIVLQLIFFFLEVGPNLSQTGLTNSLCSLVSSAMQRESYKVKQSFFPTVLLVVSFGVSVAVIKNTMTRSSFGRKGFNSSYSL